MIIVRLWGGLGNQMFQYAAARRLALVNNAPLKLDLGWFANIPNGDLPRKYELGVFGSIQEVASASEVKALRGPDTRRWPKLAKHFLARAGLLVKQSCVRERYYHFDPAILELCGDAYLDGYWQSPRYFVDIAESIRREFKPICGPDTVNSELIQAIGGCNSVSVHIRRGDYVANEKTGQYHGVCSLEYYRKAVAEISARVTAPHLFVFSDEPEWVKGNLSADIPLTCVEYNGPEKGYEDLRLMTVCRHHIIANSSFSWWGAWLSSSPGKIVIAPKRWFNREDINTSDLLPEEWLKL